MAAWITVSLLTSMIVATRFAPTSTELLATFSHAQRFYASGAYDQAIEKYEEIAASESRFLDTRDIRVEAAGIEAPLVEVAVYQLGNTHFRMGEAAMEEARQARSQEERDAHRQDMRRLLTQAAQYFAEAEKLATVPTLRALARSQQVACWYQMEEYERAIEEAQTLIERYPGSQYVQQAMYDIGWAYYELEDYPASIAAFEQMVDRYTSGFRYNRALFQIGECYREMGQPEKAIPFYRRLVEDQRLDEMTQQDILRMQRERLAGLVSETELEVAARALLRIGESNEALGRIQEAAAAYEQVSTYFADDRRLAEEAYLRQAELHASQGDDEASIAVYHRAMERQQDAFGRARIRLLIANRYFETGRFPEAVREYDTYRRNHSTRAGRVGLSVEGAGLQIARAWFRHAEQLPEAERPEIYRRAESELRHTLGAFPGSEYETELWFNLGLALERQQEDRKLEEALVAFNRVTEAPGAGGFRHSALFQKARIHHERKAFDQAREVYRQVIDELGDRSEADIARFELGVVERDAENRQQAITEFLAVRSAARLHARSRLEAGRMLLNMGERGRAITVLEEGAESAKTSETESPAFFYYLIGATLSAEGNLEASVPYFDQAVDHGGEDFIEQALYGRGVTLFRLGRYEAAIEDLNRTWKDPALADTAPPLLAAAYTSLNMTDEALSVYRELMVDAETAFERAEYLLALAEVAYRQRAHERVIEACQELLQMDVEETALPEDEREYFLKEKAYWLLADVGLRTRNFEHTMAYARAGKEAYPGGYYEPDFLYLAGLAALQLDRHAEAVDLFSEFTDRHPHHDHTADSYYYLGYAYFNQSLFSQAIPVFQKIVADYPELDIVPDALFRVGEAHFNLRRFKEAKAYYRQVVETYPETELAEQAMHNIGWCVMNDMPHTTEEEPAWIAAVQDVFQEYLDRYPQGQYVAITRYTLAEMFYNEGNYDRAYTLFRQIEADFPGSEPAQQAQMMIPELREAVAYREYSEIVERFNLAIEAEDRDAIRGLIPEFQAFYEKYPNTSSGIAAQVNIGVCYQRLEEWQLAVDTFEALIAAADAGHEQVTPSVRTFVERRRNAVVRNHL